MFQIKKKKIIAVFVSIGMMISMMSGLAFTASAATPAETAIAKIVACASNSNASSLSNQDLLDAGVTPATEIVANLTAYQTAVAASPANQVATIAQIQALVNSVNLAEAIKTINNRAHIANPTTAAELSAAGAIGAIVENETLYQSAILAAAVNSLNTTALIQALVTSVNASSATTAVTTIKGYATAQNAAGLTTALLHQAGITGAIDANLTAYQAAIVALAGDGTLLDTAAKIQTLVDGVNAKIAADKAAAAFIKIETAAANSNASGITIQDLVDAGVVGAITGTLSANLTAYQTAIAAAPQSQVSTLPQVQAIVDTANAKIVSASAAYSAALTAIQGYAANKDASSLTIAQLTAVNVTNAGDFNLGAHNADYTKSTGYIGAIEGAGVAGVSSTSLIQALITGVNSSEQAKAVIAINAFTSTTISNLTITLLQKAGVTTTDTVVANNAISANLPSYEAVILKAPVTALSLPTIITKANTALTAIAAYTATTVSGLTTTQLTDAGVASVDAANLAAYKTAIGGAALTTLAQIQAVVNTANTAANLQTAIGIVNAAKGNSANTITAAQLIAAGAKNVDSSLVSLPGGYDATIGLAATTDLSTTALIQALVDSVNLKFATVTIIKNYAANKDASALTIAQLKTAGITGTVDANLVAYQVKISKTPANQANTIALIQGLIDGVNSQAITDAIAKVVAYDSTTVANLTIADLTATGATGIIDANLAAYKAVMAPVTDITTINAAIVSANTTQRNAMVILIQGYAANDNAALLTLDQLAAAGVTGAIDANLVAYKYAIALATADQAATQGLIQGIINTVNTKATNDAIAAINAYTAATVSGLSIAQLTAAGITPATLFDANLAAYRVAIATNNAATTHATIQQVVTQVNTDQALITAINVIKAYSGNASAMALAQLTAAGITTVSANLPAYIIAVTASASSALDTTAHIQAVINAADTKVATLALMAAYNNGTSSPLTVTDFANIGVTGAITANLVAYQIALTGAAADTAAKVQKIVTDANTAAINNAIALIQQFAANDNVPDASAFIGQLTAAGVINVVPGLVGLHDSDVTKSTDYIGAIERATALQVATTKQIQDLIDAVNANVQSATITGVTGGTVVGTIPTGSNDPAYVPTLTVSIPTTVTSISSASFTAFGASKVSLYTASDFTGLVDATGFAIASNSSVLYAKVVSGDGISTKFFKVILNVVDTTTKYQIAAPGFVKAGTNEVATVTIDRATAASLSAPKLFVIYTLADGVTTVYQTLEITLSDTTATAQIVCGAGFSHIQAIVINGNVDWAAGIPLKKSQQVINLDVPAL